MDAKPRNSSRRRHAPHASSRLSSACKPPRRPRIPPKLVATTNIYDCQFASLRPISRKLESRLMLKNREGCLLRTKRGYQRFCGAAFNPARVAQPLRLSKGWGFSLSSSCRFHATTVLSSKRKSPPFPATPIHAKSACLGDPGLRKGWATGLPNTKRDSSTTRPDGNRRADFQRKHVPDAPLRLTPSGIAAPRARRI